MRINALFTHVLDRRAPMHVLYKRHINRNLKIEKSYGKLYMLVGL